MSHEIEIPQEVAHVVVERGKIWGELDAARNRAGQLNQLAEKIGGLTGATDDINQSLTKSDDPRIEIEKVLTEVGNHVTELSKIDSEISEAQKQIEAIKSRATTMIILIVIGVAIAGFALFAVISNAS